jgi:hypothetical protein
MQVVHIKGQVQEPVKRVPLYKNPVYMAQVKERIDQHKRDFHKKRDLQLQLKNL